jgi:hypothetical protein
LIDSKKIRMMRSTTTISEKKDGGVKRKEIERKRDSAYPMIPLLTSTAAVLDNPQKKEQLTPPFSSHKESRD